MQLTIAATGVAQGIPSRCGSYWQGIITYVLRPSEEAMIVQLPKGSSGHG